MADGERCWVCLTRSTVVLEAEGVVMCTYCGHNWPADFDHDQTSCSLCSALHARFVPRLRLVR